MRIGALLFVGFGLLLAAACNADTSSDLVCTSGGGTCVPIEGGMAACGEQLSGSTCDIGYVCCTPGAAPILVNEAGLPIEPDASTVVATPTDAASRG